MFSSAYINTQLSINLTNDIGCACVDIKCGPLTYLKYWMHGLNTTTTLHSTYNRLSSLYRGVFECQHEHTCRGGGRPSAGSIVESELT